MCAMCPNGSVTNMTKHQSKMYLKDLIIIDANGNVSEGLLESRSDSSNLERTKVVESLQTAESLQTVEPTEPTNTPQPQKQAKPKGRPAKRK